MMQSAVELSGMHKFMFKKLQEWKAYVNSFRSGKHILIVLELESIS